MQVADLSKKHELVSDLFAWPEKKSDWDQYRLSDEQVRFYKENGYLPNVQLLNEKQIGVLQQELSGIVSPEHPGNALFYQFYANESSDQDSVLFHALGAWRITNGFHDILWNPAFVMAASQLLDDKPVRFWHDQLFCKPARHGGVVAWHQDYSYWTRTEPMQHLTCWVGLDDATVENGCLYYVPGSHNWGLLDKPELAGEMTGLLEMLNKEQKEAFKPIPVELKKGFASFHHPLMVHGSYANRSPVARRAFVLNVFADGTVSNADTELLPNSVVIPKGDKMDGQFFPLLFDPEKENTLV
ncbi:phytanoyl-CoA dioxygenase family protein [Sediminibacterium roseum]|uniref:Phytanoyl-CoA dioxygenase family protein n=1 Tax=Sediminibacterium roseum TaxID=1978412 RepID=A0ABW9ZX27_9BACT|nr:phytanoyl-CoA dioxygenase family protein [Sediminibacterium roseum]NCI49416.1 phytanoyl-CoA dioxygenase family protein [Sediminibacterium roseum]